MADIAYPARRSGPLSVRTPVAVGLALPASRFILRGSPEVAALCGQGFGCDPPLDACRSDRRDARVALWLGPDEWLLLALDAPDPAALFIDLEGAIGGVPHSLVDVSHRQVGIAVSGERAAMLLNAGCPLDLGLRAFPASMATRTVMAKADIVLWRDAPTSFRLEVNRSLAPYAIDFLKAADAGLA